VIRNSRFRNLHADAVNFYGGVTNSVVENCHIRNTGDDALAAWSHDTRSVGSGNAFRHNYIQVPWKANCFGIYGGNDMEISDNVCADVLQYPGIQLGRQFDSHAFGGLTTVARNSLIRAGGTAYGYDQGAFRIYAQQGPVDNIRVVDLDIIDATHSAIQIQGPDYVGNTTFEDVRVQNPGASLFFLTADSKGAMDALGIVYEGSAPAFDTQDGSLFQVNKQGDGNTGW
jgi:hypothetical protein